MPHSLLYARGVFSVCLLVHVEFRGSSGMVPLHNAHVRTTY